MPRKPRQRTGKLYITHTRYGHRTHLTRDFDRTLCGLAAHEMQIRNPSTGQLQNRRIEARDHWFAGDTLCCHCRWLHARNTHKHDIDYITEHDTEGVAWVRWWCTCGASSGKTWYGSNRQATLVVQKHLAEVAK